MNKIQTREYMRMLRITQIKFPLPLFIKKRGINKRGTALLMTVMVLASILIITLGASNIILPGIVMGRTQGYSTKAYFAAEAGAEESLWTIRKATISGCPPAGECLDFSTDSCGNCHSLTYTLANGSSYYVQYASSTYTSLISKGDYLGTRRTIELVWNNP